MTFRTYPEEAYEKPKAGEEPKRYAPESELTVTFAKELDKLEYDEDEGKYHLYIRVDPGITLETFAGDWVMYGSGYKVILRVECSSGNLYIYEVYVDEEGEDSTGGRMDEYRLDPKNKMLIVGDEQLQGGSMKLQLKDETHLILKSNSGTYELTKDTEE